MRRLFLFLSILVFPSVCRPATVTIKPLVVAGGGSGGVDYGGGGAGGMLTDTAHTITAGQSYTITVGNGGTHNGGGVGNDGQNSSFADLTATGGGTGGSFFGASHSGGSGGGGGNNDGGAGVAAGSGTLNQGHNGGVGFATGQGGGGGGAGAVGTAGTASIAGAGGVGVQWDVDTNFYAGGGGAGGIGSFGAGGNGGGGAGSNQGATPATNGTANTGGGGGGLGGGGGGNSAGNGGSGVVKIAYLTASYTGGTGGTITTVGSFTVHTFNSSGTFVAPVVAGSTPTNTPTSTPTSSPSPSSTQTPTPTVTQAPDYILPVGSSYMAGKWVDAAGATNGPRMALWLQEQNTYRRPWWFSGPFSQGSPDFVNPLMAAAGGTDQAWATANITSFLNTAFPTGAVGDHSGIIVFAMENIDAGFGGVNPATYATEMTTFFNNVWAFSPKLKVLWFTTVSGSNVTLPWQGNEPSYVTAMSAVCATQANNHPGRVKFVDWHTRQYEVASDGLHLSLAGFTAAGNDMAPIADPFFYPFASSKRPRLLLFERYFYMVPRP